MYVSIRKQRRTKYFRKKKTTMAIGICLIVFVLVFSTYKIYSNASSSKITVPSFVRCSATNYTYVFKEADNDSKKLGKSYAGYVHRLLGDSGNFYKVNFYIKGQNEVGYVNKEYFIKTNPRLGIDVSKWQNDIDWKKVKSTKLGDNKIKFAIVRVGYSNSVGKCFVDEKFEKNMKGASDNGIELGVYFYSKARSVKDAQKEASFVLEKIKPYKNKIQMPVVIDYEDKESIKGLSKSKVTSICSAFVNRVKESGYKARIYSCERILKNNLKLRNLPCRVWVAKYSKKDNAKKLSYPHINHGNIWQFSSNGHVEGISGRVDLNWDMSP